MIFPAPQQFFSSGGSRSVNSVGYIAHTFSVLTENSEFSSRTADGGKGPAPSQGPRVVGVGGGSVVGGLVVEEEEVGFGGWRWGTGCFVAGDWLGAMGAMGTASGDEA